MKECGHRESAAGGDVPRATELLARLDDASLIKLVLEAVHEFDPTLPREKPGGMRAFNAGQTTTLLVYCYARGIFSSEEIEARLPYDPAIGYICAGSKPDWHLLRRFRRDNSLLMLGVLTRLLELVSSQCGMLRTAVIPERWRNGFREQALDRLREAIQADCMAMDD
jgi:Transposase domain (DUF772)